MSSLVPAAAHAFGRRHRRQLLSIGMGQVLALCVSVCSLAAGLLSRYHAFNAPAFQSLPNYGLLALFALRALPCVRRGADGGGGGDGGGSGGGGGDGDALAADGDDDAACDAPGFWRRALCVYLPLAVIDVEANYAVVYAFQFTDVASVILLDCWAIPCVLLLSRFALGLRYSRRHMAGAALCVAGVCVVVAVDWLADGVASKASNALLGDFLALLGATLYGLSNVGQEMMVVRRSRSEFMGMLGLFGTLVGGLQSLVLEWDRLAAVDFSSTVVLLLALFALFQFLQYALTPTMMRIAGSAFFNLSLLTSDGFGMIISVLVFGRQFSVQYLASGLIIIAGIVLYQSAGEPVTYMEQQRKLRGTRRRRDALTINPAAAADVDGDGDCGEADGTAHSAAGSSGSGDSSESDPGSDERTLLIRSR